MLLACSHPCHSQDAHGHSGSTPTMLLWKHVTQQHLATLRRPHDEPCEVLSTQKPDPAATGCSPSWRALRELAAADAAGLDAHQEAVLVDLYGGALRQGEAWGFSDTKLSVLVGLVKETHMGSVTGRMTLESSFQAFKEGLLRHSVQRCGDSASHVCERPCVVFSRCSGWMHEPGA